MKIKSERETRRDILLLAKEHGCEKDIMIIFDKYDKALHKCTNEQERKHIAHCGAAELHKFFYCKGNLVIDGIEILPADKDDDRLVK
jgi:hypothetical protein